MSPFFLSENISIEKNIISGIYVLVIGPVLDNMNPQQYLRLTYAGVATLLLLAVVILGLKFYQELYDKLP